MEKRLLSYYSERLKSLGHPTRLQIAFLLIDKRYSVNEICEKLKVPQATISQHLAILRNKGIVVGDRSGTTINYGLSSQTTREWISSLLVAVYETGSNSPFTQEGQELRSRI